jgi:hypothetical protein
MPLFMLLGILIGVGDKLFRFFRGYIKTKLFKLRKRSVYLMRSVINRLTLPRNYNQLFGPLRNVMLGNNLLLYFKPHFVLVYFVVFCIAASHTNFLHSTL